MTGLARLRSERFFNAHPQGATQENSLLPKEPILIVLLLAHTNAFAAAVARKLSSRFHDSVDMDVSKTKADFEERLNNRRYDIILLEYVTKEANVVLARALAVCPDTPVIIIGGMIGEEWIAGLLQQGAVDYVLKDRIGRLPYAVMHALQNAQTRFEKNQAKEALARSLKHLEEAQRVARMGSFEYDYTRNCIAWSDEVYRILGIDPIKTEFSAEAVLATMDACDRERIIADWHTALNGYTVLDGTYSFTYPAGRKRWFHVRAQVSIDDQTQKVKMIGTVQDITEAKEAEQKARRRAEFEHAILKMSRELINASPDQFEEAMGCTMRVIAQHCQTNWAAIYRFDEDAKFQSPSSCKLHCYVIYYNIHIYQKYMRSGGKLYAASTRDDFRELQRLRWTIKPASFHVP